MYRSPWERTSEVFNVLVQDRRSRCHLLFAILPADRVRLLILRHPLFYLSPSLDTHHSTAPPAIRQGCLVRPQTALRDQSSKPMLKRLADFAYSVFAALGCIMLYTTVIAAFLVVFLSATFSIIVASLISMNSKQEADSENLRAAVGVQCGLPDAATAATIDISLLTTANGSSTNVPILQVNGRIHEPRPRVVTTKLLPAIPHYLEDASSYTTPLR